MANIFNTIYREEYTLGYQAGQNPYSMIELHQQASEAFLCGYKFGRASYEKLNGPVSAGVPAQIVTESILEEFLLAGMLGMTIEDEGYTAHQLSVISTWYQSGIEKYNPDDSIYLLALLERNGIEV